MEVLPQGRNLKKLSEIPKSGEALLFNLKVHTNLTEAINNLRFSGVKAAKESRFENRKKVRCCMALISPCREAFTGSILRKKGSKRPYRSVSSFRTQKYQEFCGQATRVADSMKSIETRAADKMGCCFWDNDWLSLPALYSVYKRAARAITVGCASCKKQEPPEKLP